MSRHTFNCEDVHAIQVIRDVIFLEGFALLARELVGRGPFSQDHGVRLNRAVRQFKRGVQSASARSVQRNNRLGRELRRRVGSQQSR